MELKKIKRIQVMQLKLDVLVSLRKKVSKDIRDLNILIPKLIRDLKLEDANSPN